MKHIKNTALFLILAFTIASCGSGDGVFFVNVKDGDTVDRAALIEMGVNGMEIEPAGPVNAGKGHHHIIIDGSFIPEGQQVPANATHIHFGKGQTEALIKLEPGEHTLTLQFADGIHNSYGESWSKTITVKVE